MARDPKRLVLDHLKRAGVATVAELAEVLGVTSAAIRQHLDQLEVGGLVCKTPPSLTSSGTSVRGRGRPAAAWSLTEMASEIFPDRHGELTVDLLSSIRQAVGDDGLDRILAKRSQGQRQAYARTVGDTPVKVRAQALARLRSEEGYMAELVDEGDDGLVLVEHHCPIGEAAAECQGLCREELETFRYLFSDVATVDREAHLLGGDRRCTYRIRPH